MPTRTELQVFPARKRPALASVDEWRDNKWASRQSDDEVRCPSCGGQGSVLCCECDNESNCSRCDGEGTVLAEDVDEKEKQACFSHHQWIHEAAEEVIRLARWLGEDPIAVLTDYGFQPSLKLNIGSADSVLVADPFGAGGYRVAVPLPAQIEFEGGQAA